MDRFEPSQQPERASFHPFSPPAGGTDSSPRARAWKGDSFSFRDFLDIINPLQHLPVVSTVYRWLTGDTIGAVPRMIGDGLFGGPVGFVSGFINATVQQKTGKDLGEQAIVALGGNTGAPAADAKTVAAKETPQEAGPPLSGSAAPPAAAATAAAETVVASAAPVQSSRAVAAVPAGPAEAAGPRAAPTLAAAPGPADPRGLFLARQNMLHRQLAANDGALPGRALSNRVVPLQGIAVPAGLLQPSAPSAAARIARPAGTEASAAPPALPTNPPIDISQQMMDALDKYTRLQQQRGDKADAGRGAQLDIMQ
jgi:hypothetical protein